MSINFLTESRQRLYQLISHEHVCSLTTLVRVLFTIILQSLSTEQFQLLIFTGFLSDYASVKMCLTIKFQVNNKNVDQIHLALVEPTSLRTDRSRSGSYCRCRS